DVYQVIRSHVEIPVIEHDLSHLDAAEQAAEIQRRSLADAGQLYDLKEDLLFRVQLLRLTRKGHAPEESVVLFNMHHIVSDGWSMEIFFRELSECYAAFRRGDKAPLKPLTVQYADFACWQRHWLQGEVLQQQLEYWRQQLAGSPPVHSFPLDYQRPRHQDFRGKTYHQYLPPVLAARIREFCQQHNVTLFMFLQTAYAVLVSRYSGAQDVMMGTPVAGRLHKDVEPMIGFFINMLTLRNDLSGDPDFREMLARNRGMLLDSFAHQHIPFEMLVEELNPERNLSHSPLFQLAFAMPTHEQMKLSLGNVEHEALKSGAVPSKFDIGLSVLEEGERLRVNWVYCDALFD
ncbi:MAG: condensation domain-containing protein, partial [Wenzhouxiangellaceae bacterium]